MYILLNSIWKQTWSTYNTNKCLLILYAGCPCVCVAQCFCMKCEVRMRNASKEMFVRYPLHLTLNSLHWKLFSSFSCMHDHHIFLRFFDFDAERSDFLSRIFRIQNEFVYEKWMCLACWLKLENLFFFAFALENYKFEKKVKRNDTTKNELTPNTHRKLFMILFRISKRNKKLEKKNIFAFGREKNFQFFNFSNQKWEFIANTFRIRDSGKKRKKVFPHRIKWSCWKLYVFIFTYSYAMCDGPPLHRLDWDIPKSKAFGFGNWQFHTAIQCKIVNSALKSIFCTQNKLLRKQLEKKLIFSFWNWNYKFIRQLRCMLCAMCNAARCTHRSFTASYLWIFNFSSVINIFIVHFTLDCIYFVFFCVGSSCTLCGVLCAKLPCTWQVLQQNQKKNQKCWI